MAEQELFVEVHARFADAGLTLPAPLQIEFAEERDPCGGHPAVYAYQEHAISFCRPSNRDWTDLRKLITHELAHAWDDKNMTEEMRNAYMAHFEYGDSVTWLDPDLPHDQRPGEKFTGTISAVVQGLIDLDRLEVVTG